MYIIDESYFVRELSIPNTSEIDVSDTANPFEYWIDTEARLILKEALGYELFKDFDSYMVNGVLTGAPEKWTDLQNGKEYTYDGKTWYWTGLISTEGSVPRSLLAYYVYAKWFKFQMSQMTGMGEMTGNASNSTLANGASRESKAWNSFVDWYQGDMSLFQIIWGSDLSLNDFFKDYQQTYFASLLKFLWHNSDTYEGAALTLHGRKNRFSI